MYPPGMNATPGFQTLLEEYEIYVSMWNAARVTDGPTSPVTQFVRKLVEQTAMELTALKLANWGNLARPN